MKPWVFLKPGFDVRMGMCSVVVENQVQGFVLGKLTIETTQEFQKLLMPVPLIAVADDGPLQDIEGSEQ